MRRPALIFLVLVGVVVAALGQLPKSAGATSSTFTGLDENLRPGSTCQGSNTSGTNVNCNIYNNKQDVFLNAGPSGANLAPGTYFFTVTNPSAGSNPELDGNAGNLSYGACGGGTYLQRSFTVNADGSITYIGPHLFDPLTGDIQLYSFCDSTNGEYKLYICAYTLVNGVFTEGACKTDNFKIGSGSTTTTPTTTATATATATGTLTVTPTSTATSTVTASATPTDTSIVFATATPTATSPPPIIFLSPTPTSTPVPTATSTPVPPTATNTVVVSPPPPPPTAAVATAAPTATSTAVPPTDTPVPPVPTNTPKPPKKKTATPLPAPTQGSHTTVKPAAPSKQPKTGFGGTAPKPFAPSHAGTLNGLPRTGGGQPDGSPLAPALPALLGLVAIGLGVTLRRLTTMRH